METKTAWIARAEEAIRALRDVENVRIQGEGETIREIHVLSRSNRPPKHIVRDVQTALITQLNRSIDYRVVSVAYLGAEGGAGPMVGNGADPVRSLPIETPVEPARTPATAAEPTPAPPAEAPLPREAPRVLELATEGPEPAKAAPERIRFGSVNLFVSGARTQAQVELRWRGLPRLGSAAGWSTRSGAHRLVAQATLAAVQEFLADEIALGLVDVEFLRLGRKRAAVVSLSMLVDRQEKILVGSCVIEQDLHQAVVFGTLAALNRLVDGLRPKEPTEYVLRPTSAQ